MRDIEGLGRNILLPGHAADLLIAPSSRLDPNPLPEEPFALIISVPGFVVYHNGTKLSPQHPPLQGVIYFRVLATVVSAFILM